MNEILVQIQNLEKKMDDFLEKMEKRPGSEVRQSNIARDRYTIREVAEIAGCSKETIKNHVRCGYLKVRYPMGKRKFHNDDVEKYLRGIR